MRTCADPPKTAGFAGLRLMLVLAVFAIGLVGSMVLPGCSTLTNIEQAITGQQAVLTVKIVGSTVDSIMTTAAKAHVLHDLTDAQWQTLGALHDKFQPIYQAEVAAIVKANGATANTTPTAALTALMSQIIATAEAFKKPAPPAK